MRNTDNKIDPDKYQNRSQKTIEDKKNSDPDKNQNKD